jgi:radical SAM protein with 4Fe4S-binding SPASM domain
VQQIALSRFSPAGYAAEQAAALLPSRADVMDSLAAAAAFAGEHDMRVSCTMPIPPCMMETGDYAPIEFGVCPIGTDMQELALGPDGALRNCTLHRDALGDGADIGDASVDLHALLDEPKRTAYQAELPAFCEGCVHASSCGGGCGAAARWMFGDDAQRLPDPFLWQHVDEAFGEQLERQRRDGRRRLDVIP